MSEVSEGAAVMTAITKALKSDKTEKGLYPEDLYLINYLTRAVKVFQEKGLTSFERKLWGVKLTGISTNDLADLKMSFTYSLHRPHLEEELKSIINQADSFYIRCMGAEIVRYPDRIEVNIDGDDMKDGQKYNIAFEAPETFKCVWRR